MSRTTHHACFCTKPSPLLVILALAACSALGTVAASAQSIEGYLSSYSAVLGGSVDIHTSTTASTYTTSVYHIGVTDSNLLKVNNIPATSYSTPTDAYQTGAGWQSSYNLQIPNTWAPGLLQVVVRTNTSGSGVPILLPLRPSIPGSTSKILVLDNAPTQQAYNNWGGKSLYSFNSSDSTPADIVSLQRPDSIGIARNLIKFARWADAMHIPVEYASSFDLDSDPTLLANYNVVVMAGQNEYWSKNMRDNFDTFTHNGGNAMLLSGNTMWWQFRINGDQMVCYKNPATDDPMYGVDNSVVTTNWYADPINDPENRSIGVSWRNGGFVNAFGYYTAAQGYGGYTVTDASHWLYNGTGLQNGDVFGQGETILQTEADGALFTWVDGKPVPTGTDGTPLNFQILGYAPAATPDRNGYATMGMFDVPGGGTVFNAATINWAGGLALNPDGTPVDPIVSQITLNAITHLSASVPEPLSLIFVSSTLGLLMTLRKRMLPGQRDHSKGLHP